MAAQPEARRLPRLPGARATQRARAERRLGWSLCAPAFGVMLAVTAYPMLHALWLSLQSYRITDPDSRRFVGLDNYALILTDSIWWQSGGVALLIPDVTVPHAAGAGFA